jgi:hypothetical protein
MRLATLNRRSANISSLAVEAMKRLKLHPSQAHGKNSCQAALIAAPAWSFQASALALDALHVAEPAGFHAAEPDELLCAVAAPDVVPESDELPFVVVAPAVFPESGASLAAVAEPDETPFSVVLLDVTLVEARALNVSLSVVEEPDASPFSAVPPVGMLVQDATLYVAQVRAAAQYAAAALSACPSSELAPDAFPSLAVLWAPVSIQEPVSIPDGPALSSSLAQASSPACESRYEPALSFPVLQLLRGVSLPLVSPLRAC